jgi:hypothetical protein
MYLSMSLDYYGYKRSFESDARRESVTDIGHDQL